MVRVGLLGVGFLGKIHLKLLLETEDVSLVGFYDTNPTNASDVEKSFDVTLFGSFEQLLPEVDAVVIASPTTTHFDYASRCIASKKHVFIEKPATSTIDEGKDLKKQLKENPVVVQVGHVERFNPALHAVADRISGVKQIFCNRLAPFTPRGADVSVVYDVMIHDLDVVRSLVKSPVKQIIAHGQKIISNTTDVANAVVEFESGVKATFTASRMAERKYRTTDIIAEDGIYHIDFLNKKSEYLAPDNAAKKTLLSTYLESPSSLRKERIEVEEYNAIGRELSTFIDSIQNNKKVVVSLDDGIGAMELAHAVEEQMNE